MREEVGRGGEGERRKEDIIRGAKKSLFGRSACRGLRTKMGGGGGKKEKGENTQKGITFKIFWTKFPRTSIVPIQN